MCRTPLAKDDAENVSRLEQHVKRGNSQGAWMLAEYYKNWIGVEKTPEQVAQLYILAAEKGHAEAAWALALCYQSGTGVAQSDEEYLKWT
jgi:TPR repeat protein